MNNMVAVVLGGGRGTRLQPLTSYRSKPAVPLAGKYRLIDIPLSNCINSGINRIFVLTQFMSVSLHSHIRGTYRFDSFSNGFVEILAAQQTLDEDDEKRAWYQGTADAVRKNMKYLMQPGIEYVLILSGDQLYRMDFEKMLKAHIESEADVTIAGKPVDRTEAGALGVMRVDNSGRVNGFLEKPQTKEELDTVAMDPAWIDTQGVESKGRDCVASMGIYLFSRQTLIDVLEKTDYQDFGKEVFPASIRAKKVQLHMFDGYWEDIGTIRSYYEANLQLAQANAPFDLTSENSPIYSRPRYLPPTRIDTATINQSLIADGCVIKPGAVIENSVIGLRCRIGKNVVIKNSVIMGADFYESEPQDFHEGTESSPSIGIGDNTVIENAIIDKNCRIGSDCNIVCSQGTLDNNLQNGITIQEGIVVVEKNATIPDGWSV